MTYIIYRSSKDDKDVLSMGVAEAVCKNTKRVSSTRFFVPVREFHPGTAPTKPTLRIVDEIWDL